MDARELHQKWDEAIRSINDLDHGIAPPSDSAETMFRDAMAVLRAWYFNEPPDEAALLVAGGIHVAARGDNRELRWELAIYNTGEVSFWHRSRASIDESRRRQ